MSISPLSSAPPSPRPEEKKDNPPQEKKIIDFKAIVDIQNYICPINLGLMKKPVIIVPCGHRCSMKPLLEHFKNKLTCPTCNNSCARQTIEDRIMREEIEKLKKIDEYQESEESEDVLPDKLHVQAPIAQLPLFRAAAMMREEPIRPFIAQNNSVNIQPERQEPTYKEKRQQLCNEYKRETSKLKLNIFFIRRIMELQNEFETKDKSGCYFRCSLKQENHLTDLKELTQVHLQELNKLKEEYQRQQLAYRNSFSPPQQQFNYQPSYHQLPYPQPSHYSNNQFPYNPQPFHPSPYSQQPYPQPNNNNNNQFPYNPQPYHGQFNDDLQEPEMIPELKRKRDDESHVMSIDLTESIEEKPAVPKPKFPRSTIINPRKGDPSPEEKFDKDRG